MPGSRAAHGTGRVGIVMHDCPGSLRRTAVACGLGHVPLWWLPQGSAVGDRGAGLPVLKHRPNRRRVVNDPAFVSGVFGHVGQPFRSLVFRSFEFVWYLVLGIWDLIPEGAFTSLFIASFY